MGVVLPLLPTWSRWLLVALVAGLLLYGTVLAPPAVLIDDGEDGPPRVTVDPTPDATTADEDDGVDLFEALAAALGFAASQWRHLLGYATLAVTLAYAMTDRPQARRVRVALVVGGTIAYGGCLELLQLAVPGRTFAPTDLLVNAAGAALVLPWYALEPHLEARPLGDDDP